MDLLFKRYASPFNFLDGLLKIGQLKKGVEHVLMQEAEQKLWELYLHSHPSCSFKKWKEEVLSNSKPKEMSETEIANVVRNAESILNTFHL